MTSTPPPGQNPNPGQPRSNQNSPEISPEEWINGSAENKAQTQSSQENNNGWAQMIEDAWETTPGLTAQAREIALGAARKDPTTKYFDGAGLFEARLPVYEAAPITNSDARSMMLDMLLSAPEPLATIRAFFGDNQALVTSLEKALEKGSFSFEAISEILDEHMGSISAGDDEYRRGLLETEFTNQVNELLDEVFDENASSEEFNPTILSEEEIAKNRRQAERYDVQQVQEPYSISESPKTDKKMTAEEFKAEVEEIQELRKQFPNGDYEIKKTKVLASTEHPEILRGLDLSGIKLIGCDLRGLDLRLACFDSTNLKKTFLNASNLEGASFNGADLSNASLQDCNLKGASFNPSSGGEATLLNFTNLRRTNLEGAQFQEAAIDGSFFSGSLMNEANFSKAKIRFSQFTPYKNAAGLLRSSLRGVNFANAEIQHSRFSGANLAEANFTNAIITPDCDLDDCILNEARFGGAELIGVNFRDSRLAGAKFCKEREKPREGQERFYDSAILKDADLSHAKLSKTEKYPAADLRGVVLDGARLFGTDCREVDAYKAQFNGADLFDVDFKGANLEKARFSYNSEIDEKTRIELCRFGAANLKKAQLLQCEIVNSDFDKGINLDGTVFDESLMHKVRFGANQRNHAEERKELIKELSAYNFLRFTDPQNPKLRAAKDKLLKRLEEMYERMPSFLATKQEDCSYDKTDLRFSRLNDSEFVNCQFKNSALIGVDCRGAYFDQVIFDFSHMALANCGTFKKTIRVEAEDPEQMPEEKEIEVETVFKDSSFKGYRNNGSSKALSLKLSNLDKAQLQGTIFELVDISDVLMQEALLTECIYQDSTISANCNNARLDALKFNNCKINRLDIDGAVISEVDWNGKGERQGDSGKYSKITDLSDSDPDLSKSIIGEPAEELSHNDFINRYSSDEAA